MTNSRRTRTSKHHHTAAAADVATDAGHGQQAWTPEAIRALGLATDLRTAAQIFGLSPNTAYNLVRRGEFPVPVIRAGNQYRVPGTPILAALHVDVDPTPPPAASGPPPPTAT